MNRLLDIMRSDIITMKGAGNSLKWLAVITYVLSIGMGFFVTPLAGAYMPLLVSMFLPSLLFGNEVKFHSEKMYCLMPVSRREIVNARFFMVIGANLAISLVSYILMVIAIRLRVYDMFDDINVLEEMIKKLELDMTQQQLFDLIFSVALAFGCGAGAGYMRAYFKDASVLSGSVSVGKGLKKSDYIGIAVAFIAIIFVICAVIGVIPVGAASVLISQLVIQLASAADGRFISVLCLFIAIMESLFQYFSTQIEFSDKEL